MAQGVEESFGSAVEDAKRRSYEARTRAVADGQAAYERGRQIYADAIRTGRNVVARTPQEVRALGGAVNAGVRSAANAASLGLADNLDAITGAAFGAGGSGNFAARYRNQLAEQHALDRQAAQDHRFATKTGNFLGTFGGIFAADAPVAAGAAARMIPGSATAFRISAGLTPAQKRAVPELGEVYLPDHWLPSDIGNFSGGWIGPVAGQRAPDDGTPR
jgi:hypothetical protein